MTGAVRLAVLGDPLAYTRSPDLHRAGLGALGLEGESMAIRTTPAELGARLESLAAEGLRGVNLTHPLKEAALAHVTRSSAEARRARSVNTVTFEPDGIAGDTTDGAGFVDFLAAEGDAEARAQRPVLLGAGGAARSLALALVGTLSPAIVVIARDPSRAAEGWRDLPQARLVRWGTAASEEALATASLVVNATPMAGADGPIPIEALGADAAVVDLVYGPEVTPWIRAARAAGHAAWDGLGLLVHQARHSLARWTGREVPLAPLASAVGWPR